MKIIQVLFLMLFSMLVSQSYAADANVIGNYTCMGADALGQNKYTNPVTVTKNGSAYIIQWMNTSGNPYNVGTGIVNTSVSDSLAATFWDPATKGSVGVILYHIASDGSMQGNWALMGGSTVGVETCTKK